MQYTKLELLENFMTACCGWQANDSLEEIAESVQRAKDGAPVAFAKDLQTFKEYTLDESIPFMKKAKIMLDFDPVSEEQAVEAWKEIWDLLTEGEPFPIDEHGKPIR